MAGALASIMSMFSPAGGAHIQPANPNPGIPAVVQPTQVAQPGIPMPGTHSSPGTAPNGLVPTGATEPPIKPVNPLDGLTDIWMPVKDAKVPESIADMFKNLDVKKLQEQAATVDFTKVATAEDMTRINAGGQGAMTAMMEVMNKAVQMGYAQSAVATTKIVEQALTRAQSIQDTSVAEAIKRAGISQAIAKENPVLTHPAFAPVVGALQTQFTQKNPNATVDEINRQVIDALSVMGAALNPTKAVSATSGTKSGEMDWDKFLG